MPFETKSAPVEFDYIKSSPGSFYLKTPLCIVPQPEIPDCMCLYALAQKRRFSKENHGEIGSTTMSLYDSARDNLVKWHFKVNEPSKDLTIDK